MRIGKWITELSDKMDHEHFQRVIYDLDLDKENPEVFARVEGMGITLNFLKWINGITQNWYSFQGLRDRVIFIFLYPISISFCYAFFDAKRIVRYIKKSLK